MTKKEKKMKELRSKFENLGFEIDRWGNVILGPGRRIKIAKGWVKYQKASFGKWINIVSSPISRVSLPSESKAILIDRWRVRLREEADPCLGCIS